MAIQPNHETLQHPYAKAAQTGQLASAVLMAITGIAIAALYAMDPQGFLLQANRPALAILGSVGSAALAGFVVSTLVHYCANRKTVEEPKTAPAITDPLNASASNSIPQPQANKSEATAPIKKPDPILTDPLALQLVALIASTMDEVENLILAFNAAYYRAEGKNQPENEAKIRQATLILKKLIISLATEKLHVIFQNKQVRVVMSINPHLPSMINNDLILENLTKTPDQFLALLSGMLTVPAEITPAQPAVCACVPGIFAQIAAHPSPDQQTAFSESFKALQTAYSNYASLEKTTPQDNKTIEHQEALEQLWTIFYEKRDELFTNLLKAATTPEEVDAWANLLLDAYVKGIFEYVNDILAALFKGFDKEGIFNQAWYKPMVFGATTAPETACDKGFGYLPPAFPHREEGLAIAKMLLSALANPLYYATCIPVNLKFWGDPEPHAFYKGVKTLLEDKGKKLTPPLLDPKTSDWKGYVAAYTTYLQTFTAELAAMFPKEPAVK